MDWRSYSRNARSRLTAFPIVRDTTRRWMRLGPATRALPMHLWRAIINFKNHGPRQAAALSYYAIFSVFPLSLLLAVGISAILGPTVAEQQIVDGLRLFLPEETDTINLLQDSIQQALNQSGSFGIIALVGLTWSALGLFSNLTGSLEIIFQVPSGRGMWRSRVLAFLMTLILIVLVVVSFLASGILRLINAFLLSNPSTWITIATFFLPLGVNLLIFVLLFRYVPSRLVNWDAVWPASILGAIALELAKAGFAWYLSSLANFQIIYGGIATVIILLLWAYLVACIFLISAEICAQLNLWFLTQQEQVAPRTIQANRFSQLPAEIPPPV